MDLDTLVAGADPVRRRELDRADSAAAERLYHQIIRLGPAGGPRGGGRLAGESAGGARGGGRLAGEPARRSRGGRPMWPAVLAGTAVLVAAAVAAGLLARPGTRSTAAGRMPVATVLDAAAIRAEHGAGAGLPPGPGQYLYVHEVVAKGLGSGQGCPEAPMSVQAWVAADGSGRQIGTFPAPCRKLNFDQTYRKGGVPGWLYAYIEAGSLPTDPVALRHAIVRRFEHGHPLPSATFAYAAMLLNAGSPPAVRAALYRVIESLPGVRNLGPVRDRLGRLGQGVGLVTAGSRSELIFDPGSTSVLEDEMVAVRPPQDGNNYLPADTVMQYVLYVQQGVVNSDRATPAGAAR